MEDVASWCPELNGDVMEAGAAYEVSKLTGIVQREDQSHEPSRLRADVTRERLVHDREDGRRRSGHIHDQTTAGHQDTPHLPECSEFVWHELEPQLAQDDVERLIRQRHRLGTRLVPLDRNTGRRDRVGNRQHAGIEVEPSDGPGCADTLCREPRHDTRAAGNIQHTLTRAKRGDLDEVGCQGRAKAGTKNRS